MRTIRIKERPQDMPLADRVKVRMSHHINVFCPFERCVRIRPAQRLLRRAGLIVIAVLPGLLYAGCIVPLAFIMSLRMLAKMLTPVAWWQEQWEK